MSVKIDRNVVTFGSSDGTINIVVQMDEMDTVRLDDKLNAEGTHFIDCYNARIFVRTKKGCLVVVPQ